MALESFGIETAQKINHAVILCHDLLKANSPTQVNEIFKAEETGIWRVYAGSYLGEPVVIIELGVG